VLHILSARQFDAEQLNNFFDDTEALRDLAASDPDQLSRLGAGAIAATLFYEASTRTRLSFESAALRLGMGVISTENAALFSSAIKGESIEDTARVVGEYASTIIIRHKVNGMPEKAAAVSKVPIINAGDGTNEHPTQSLLDAYTIRREKGRLDGLNVVIGGDLKHGRTVRSLARVLSMYPGNKISFVSVDELQIGDDITTHLHGTGTKYEKTDDMFGALHDADVVYWTRLQKERQADPSVETGFVIDQAALQVMKEDAIILHPLPRVGEIDPSIDGDPRAKYFEQAANGLHVRTALLKMVLESV